MQYKFSTRRCVQESCGEEEDPETSAPPPRAQRGAGGPASSGGAGRGCPPGSWIRGLV